MNTYHYVPFSKMVSAFNLFYKINPHMEGKRIHLQHNKIHVPHSYREYVRTLNNTSQNREDEPQDQDQDWGFFVDIDHAPKVNRRQKPTLSIKTEYSYYKYVQRYTFFRSNKIVHEDEKYSSLDSFDNIGCVDEENATTSTPTTIATIHPTTIVRQTSSSAYLYQEILNRIRPSQRTDHSSSRWVYKLTFISLLMCATFIVCIAFI